MLTCSRCKLSKSVDNFAIRSSGKLQNYCKSCGRVYSQKHYEKNKPAYLARNKIRRDNIKQKLYEFLLTQKCIDCGESEVLYLDFDHRDPANKSFNLAVAMNRGFAWSKIQSEIEKCDIRCVKCHRRRTAEQFGWFKFLIRG